MSWRREARSQSSLLINSQLVISFPLLCVDNKTNYSPVRASAFVMRMFQTDTVQLVHVYGPTEIKPGLKKEWYRSTRNREWPSATYKAWRVREASHNAFCILNGTITWANLCGFLEGKQTHGRSKTALPSASSGCRIKRPMCQLSLGTKIASVWPTLRGEMCGSLWHLLPYYHLSISGR